MLPYWKDGKQHALEFNRIFLDNDGDVGNNYDNNDGIGHGEDVRHTVLLVGGFPAWQSFELPLSQLGAP